MENLETSGMSGALSTIEFTSIVWLWIVVAIIFLIGMGFLLGRLTYESYERNLRKDAIERSKSTILGNVYEKIVPMLADFPFHPKDLTFVGKGIDYIVFDGLSEGELREIIFLEIKTGGSRLNKNEQKIKNIISQKKISYREWRAKEGRNQEQS